MKLEFTCREELSDYEWDSVKKKWNRPDISIEMLKSLSGRSTWSGLWRLGFFISLLSLSLWAVLFVSRYSLWLAIPVLYVYYFFYGFWIAIAHELQHKTVFAKSADGFSEIVFFFIQALMWNSPRYARISHKLHHRYTMVRDVDPETAWPESGDSLAKAVLCNTVLKFFVAGALKDWVQSVQTQIFRALGKKDKLMRDDCTDEDVKTVRIESAAILLLHLAVVLTAIVLRRWEPIVFITFAWHMGGPFESLWHNTQHIGRPKNMNDQRLVTRSVKVNPLIKLIYWGLDDHVEHHDFPAIPSRNLPKLHRLLCDREAPARTMPECWREMLVIGREKENRSTHEYMAVSADVLNA